MIMEDSSKANYFRIYYLLPSLSGSPRYVGIDFTLIPCKAPLLFLCYRPLNNQHF